MIKVEKTKDGFRTDAKGNSGEELIGELIEATSSILAEILRDDMPESKTDEFCKKYMDLIKEETKNKKERINRNDPNMRVIAKKRPKMPWE